ncbi:MAG: AMP-binding protein [Candidatus Marinimicrobia bacterium]|jgi:long-chain acyl-CoA synthetase|nr:AMP-binding protein [Candidatus Neomarinimicrobiota bacterium]MBT4360653.1 AMP-binding protein [Candidatus Neomarinimicrobiota bacterium]MBT4715929.1 AMP-binding protein [Candidatus Neomarinimicrobiota bacterium]MBT4948138.1 AMP-binding protein [Candidatus Neomarinimicrobiota bacterium]MBT5271020.1 AMP-binding protein [Candidatus Neomarinimicrobiota bacterium]
MQYLPAVEGQTSIQLFMQAAEQWSDKVRWRNPTEHGWEAITWDTYRRKVSGVATFLHGQGYSYPDKIGILAANSLEWIYSALGVMTSTAIFVPIYAGNTIEQSLFMINHSDMQLLILDSVDMANRLIAAGLESTKLRQLILLQGDPKDCVTSLPIYCFEELSQAGATHTNSTPGLIEDLARIPQFDDIAYMIYTSGTTGDPKGVPLSHRNLATSTSDWLTVNGSLIPEDVLDIHWLPNSHIYGWGAIGLGNLFGFESYLANPINILELLTVLKPDIFMSVPAYYEKLFLNAINCSNDKDEQIEKLIELTGGNLHFLLSGGAGLKTEIKEFFLESGMWITEGYGLSECSPTLTMNHKDDYRFDSVGKRFPSVQLKLATDGEILAKGANIFSGYYKDPEATKACFTPDGWFQTGDLGIWIDDRFLKIIDRKKDIIVTSGGKNIAPQNIERKFTDHPEIEHIVIYGDAKKYLVALITLNENFIRQKFQALDPDTAKWKSIVNRPEVIKLIQKAVDQVNNTLPSFETIKYFHISDQHFSPANGLLTAALKLRRKAAIEQFRSQLDDLYIVHTDAISETVG